AAVSTWLAVRATAAEAQALRDRDAKDLARKQAEASATSAAKAADEERKARVAAQKAGAAERRARLAAQKAEAAERDAKNLAGRRLGQIQKANAVRAGIFHDLDPWAEASGGPDLRQQLSKRLQQAAAQLDGEAVGDPPTVATLQHFLGRALSRLGHAPQA